MKRRDFIKYGAVFAGGCGVCFICKNGNMFIDKTSKTASVSNLKPCKKPFECFEIHTNGNVYPCCPEFLKYKAPAGSISSILHTSSK